jgi:hypothetical protein
MIKTMRSTLKVKVLLVTGFALLLAAVPALAHHALAAVYDTRQSIMLKGTVTKIVWNNPHVHLYLRAADKASDASWDFEMGSPNLLMLNGWKIDTFRQGDRVLVTAYPARDGSRVGYASKVALSAP